MKSKKYSLKKELFSHTMTYEQELEFLHYFKNFEFENSLLIIAKNQNAERESMTVPNKVKDIVVLTTILTRSLIENGASEKKIMRYADEVYNEVLKFNNVSDLFQFEVEIITKFFNIYKMGWQAENLIVTKIINYVNINLDEKITVPVIAETLNMSHSYISHLFKEEKGISIKSFILERKIYRAKHLLCTTDMSITDISKQLKFNSYSYFCSIFRRFTNFAPGHYRAIQCKIPRK